MPYATYTKYGPLVIRCDHPRAQKAQPSPTRGRHTLASEPPHHPVHSAASRELRAYATLNLSVVGHLPPELVDAIDAAADGDVLYVDTQTNTILGGIPGLEDLDRPAPRRIQAIYERLVERLTQPEVSEGEHEV